MSDETTRRSLLTGAVGAAGALALGRTARAADLEADAPTKAVCDTGWEAWVAVATKATFASWDAMLGGAEWGRGRIDGPMLSGLTLFRYDRNLIEKEVAAALVDVAVPQVIAKKWSRVIASAWETVWEGWELPPTKAFPSFAAIPASKAPPTKAEPFPLRPDTSPAWGALEAKALYVEVADRLGDLANLPGLSDAVWTWASTVSKVATVWADKATVYDVVGKGPVPSFAPPYVPVGPVVGGDNISVPGHTVALVVVQPTLEDVAAELAKGDDASKL